MNTPHNNVPGSLEDLLRDAGDIIEVDEYRRPAVMEYTRAAFACQRAWRIAAVAMTLFFCVSIPLGAYLSSVRADTMARDKAVQQSLNDQLSSANWSWGTASWFERRNDRNARGLRGKKTD